MSKKFGGFLIAVVSVALFSGCATPITKEAGTPDFGGQAPAEIAIAVVDHRDYVLSGGKEEWFEGIFRGPFWIPISPKREWEHEGEPFAFYLANMLKDSFDQAGGKATILRIPKGTGFDETQKTLKGNPAGFIVMIITSRYDLGAFNPEYNYHFNVAVIDRAGEVLARKDFSHFDVGIPLSDKYNVFDMITEIYKQKFDVILNDPEIKNALEHGKEPGGSFPAS